MSDVTPGGVTVATRPRDVAALDAAVARLVESQVASKMTAQDPTLWGSDARHEASIRLSWVDLAESSRPLIAQIEALRKKLAGEGVDRVVLAGMGGSSLAPEVITATAPVRLVTLDTTDAGQVRAAITDLDRTVLVVSSKSGGTVETDSHRRTFEKAFSDAGIDAASRIVVVTDPDSPLAELASSAGYREVFRADAHVGGRYSALTAFGLVPAGLAGADIGNLLDEAAAVAPALAADDTANPGLRLGALLGLAHAAGAEKVVLADTGSGITGFGDWAEQLIAESTGKQGKGLLPVVVGARTAPGYADAGADATLVQIGPARDGDQPPSGFGASVDGPLGAQLLLWEYAIAVAGRQIGIDPFDQPNVEEAKAQARTLLDRPGADTKRTPAFTDGAVEVYADEKTVRGEHTLRGVMQAVGHLAPPAGYLSVQAYLDRHADSSAADLRTAVAHRSGQQTTFGWGPRFLHSTGQYHKGGHPNGGFIQITGAVAEDLGIPDRPYTFAVLQAAQAAGDAAVLLATGRPVLRLHLTDRAAGLGQLLEALS